jgi:2-methylcitrate dehydratase
MPRSTHSLRSTPLSTFAHSRSFFVDAVRAIRLKTFAVAHRIIGGGEEGEKHTVRTKEEADHSLPHLIAVALIDGEVQPQQYVPARIGAADVQSLLRKVTVIESKDLTAQFPQQLPADLEVHDGTLLREECFDYPGFHTTPFDWQTAAGKVRSRDRCVHYSRRSRCAGGRDRRAR